MIDITNLKSNVDLVSVLTQRGLEFKPQGSSLFARCPFHPDDTPSLSVNPKEQLWSCFGCGAGGDVFTFVQKQEGIGFVDAVKKLLKHDIQEKDLEDLNREREKTETKQVDRPHQEILDRVLVYWQKSLSRSRKAQEYLKSRGLWSPTILRPLKVGFSTGRLTDTLPQSGKLTRQLKQMGILNKKGNEFFYNRLVVPIFDESGVLMTVYGRSLDPCAKVEHLYLPGPKRGVFNPAGITEGKPVVLTESILDAISLLVLGVPNVTASFGANGFTSDLRAQLIRKEVPRVDCVYDSDPTGDDAADQLAHNLIGHGIEVRRVELDVKDPNELLVAGGTREVFLEAVEKARTLLVSSSSVTAATTSSVDSGSSGDGGLSFTFGDRTYRVEGEPSRGSGALRVTLKVSREGKTFIDTVNLYSDRARAGLISKLTTVFRDQVKKNLIEEDLFSLIDELEARVQLELGQEEKKAPMTASERHESQTFLRRPDLIEAILDDLTKLGLVGENENKLLAYLVATSRKLEKPLSLSVISRSSAGKSWLLNRVADLMPEEEVHRYTRMSPRALFYDEPGRFKHKILFIEEAIGAKDADLGVRSMQSEKRLANLVTMTDPKTGQLKTQENVVEGPLTYLTSSVEPLDHETATRSFEIAIDESVDQTERIVKNLFRDRTLTGIQARLAKETISNRHKNVQRMLEPLFVVNPYTTQLTFPAKTLRLRREADKYLSLIETLAFLRQGQRPVSTFTQEGQTHRFIRVIPDDIDRANRLMATCLARALSDLPGPAQELLLKVRDYVVDNGGQNDPMEVSFSRRDIREWVGWSDYQVRLYLDHLVDLEYVEGVSGSFGKRYVYTLSPNHQLVVQEGLTLEECIVAMGLKPASELVQPEDETEDETAHELGSEK